jgi:CubicO group peptidase (beta-lactamase class C family)
VTRTARLCAVAALIALPACAQSSADAPPAALTSTTTPPTSAPHRTTTTSRKPAATSTTARRTTTTAPITTASATSSTSPTSTTITSTSLPFPPSGPVEQLMPSGWTLLAPVNSSEAAVIELANAQVLELGARGPATFAIARDGVPIATRSAGRDIAGSPLRADTPFRVASVSKVITSMAVFVLAGQGKINLDAPLADQWTPPVAPADERFAAVTVRNLLQHRSGLAPQKDVYFGGRSNDWHLSAELALASTLGNDPGTAFRYSNSNYVLLGELIEQVTNKPYHDAVRELVFEPLGITTAAMRRTAEFQPDNPAYQVNLGRTYMEALGPAGAWEMSAADEALLIAASQPSAQTALVDPAITLDARQPMDVASPDDDWTYGLGFMLFGGYRWGHTGTIESVRSFGLNLPNGYTLTATVAVEMVDSGEGLIRRFADELDALAALAPRS